MSNIFLNKSKSNFFNTNSNTIDVPSYMRKTLYTKYNPYRPKKSNSLNHRNSFFSLMNVIKNGDSYFKKIENRRGLNYINLSLSKRNKEKNNSTISNSYTNIIKRNYNINNTKDKWYTKTSKDEKNKVINLLNSEKKIKDRENFYFKGNKRNNELNKNYFNSDFNQEEKKSGIINYKQPKLTQRLNYFIDEHLNNTFNFIPGKKEHFFNRDKQLNIFPPIQKKQIINNNYLVKSNNNYYNTISDKLIHSEEI